MLYRRALDRTERAEDTAMSCIGPQQRLAALAFVKKLASVGWHRLFLSEAAFRAGERALQDDRGHGAHLRKAVGNPASVATFARRSGEVLAGSYLTSAVCLFASIFTSSTPGCLFRITLTVSGHVAQCIPFTSSVVLWARSHGRIGKFRRQRWRRSIDSTWPSPQMQYCAKKGKAIIATMAAATTQNAMRWRRMTCGTLQTSPGAHLDGST